MKAYLLTGTFLVSDLPRGYLHKVDPDSTIEEMEMEEYPERIEYDKKKALLTSIGEKIQLVPQSDEATFAEMMFSSARGHQVSWDEIADRITGQSNEILTKPQREKIRTKVKDVRIRLNEKVLTVFGVEDYFIANKGTYSRK